MASKRKGRLMSGSELKTGDVLLTPSVRDESTVTSVRSFRDIVSVNLANGSQVELPHDAKVRVHRSTRKLKDPSDGPYIIFSTATS